MKELAKKYEINPSDNDRNLLPYTLLIILELFNLMIFFLVDNATKKN